MSYKVLARKWRPKSFDEVVGQTHIKSILINALKNNRVGHAYLFVGTRGIGKTSLARLMAKILNCKNIGENFEVCNQCLNCQEFDKGNFVDFLEIDGASNNSVDHIRAIRDNLIYPPTQGNFKIFIIDEVHMLTTQAWNALLKVLEEPPEYVKFFFATTEVHKILPTILSRCQRFDLQPIAHKDIFKQLSLIAESEKLNISNDALNLVASLGDGSMRDSLSILEQIVSLSENEKPINLDAILTIFARVSYLDIQKLYLLIKAGDMKKLFDTVHSFYQRGVDLQQLLLDMIYYGRTLLICSLNHQSKEDLNEILELNEEQLNFFIASSKEFSKIFLQSLLNNLVNYEEKLRNASSKRICFELLLNQIVQENHSVYIEDFLQSLHKVKSSIALEKKDEKTATKEIPNASTKEQDSALENELKNQSDMPKEQEGDVSYSSNLPEKQSSDKTTEESLPDMPKEQEGDVPHSSNLPEKQSSDKATEESLPDMPKEQEGDVPHSSNLPEKQSSDKTTEESLPYDKSSSNKNSDNYFEEVCKITKNFFIEDKKKLVEKSVFIDFVKFNEKDEQVSNDNQDYQEGNNPFQKAENSSANIEDKVENLKSKTDAIEGEGEGISSETKTTEINDEPEYHLDEGIKEQLKKRQGTFLSF